MHTTTDSITLNVTLLRHIDSISETKVTWGKTDTPDLHCTRTQHCLCNNLAVVISFAMESARNPVLFNELLIVVEMQPNFSTFTHLHCFLSSKHRLLEPVRRRQTHTATKSSNVYEQLSLIGVNKSCDKTVSVTCL